MLDESKAPFFKWFHDGELNVSYNCLDRHLNTQPNKVAIIFEADDGTVTKITYKQLYHRVCQFANGLKSLGIKTGDRVIVYMPMSIEAVVAMQACARIGATHSVVFGGFSAKSLQERIIDAGAVAVITADGQMRGGKRDSAQARGRRGLRDGRLRSASRTWWSTSAPAARFKCDAPRDIWWHDLVRNQPDVCEPEWVSAEHPLFILYTSGSTGKPKGVQHSSGGYLLQAMLTMKWTFDHKPTDVFWCTADVGWVTGHTYIAYGPLAVGATEIVFEGVPIYPDAGRFWKMIQDHRRDRVLHGADRDPLADQGRRRPAEEIRPVQPAAARHRRRADQSRSVDVVPHHGRRRPLPDRRYLVADRDRRAHDHAAAGRDADQTGFVHHAAAGNHRCRRGRDRS